MSPAPKRILIAGCSGRLGRAVVRALRRDGHWLRALSRRFDNIPEIAAACDETVVADLIRPDTLAGCCDNIDYVISCAGASLDPRTLGDRHSYYRVDFNGNANLLTVARQAAVRRFVYVSVFGARQQRHLEYADAHERFAEVLTASGLSGCIVRPTGFFGVFGEFFEMALAGRAIQIGDGSSRTNPIHEADLAEVCLEALYGDHQSVDAGGPQILTRRETVALAFEALNRPAKILDVAPALFRAASWMVRPVNRRIFALLEFGREVSLTDVIAPQYGVRQLSDYYCELAAARRKK